MVMAVAMGFGAEVSGIAMRFLGFIWKIAMKEERDEREKI